eukprot:CAMPEP_0116575524 /NCGR_PEP_ID=MMETSP0397-20121206/20004_1 /TAXON_ID=216820 /ORGANISM="Cyclophora tenuis, Strain ECT3854" /LENGTH=179 /DNA_ID=CAMNT_0004104423 /DNA_START=110 /DNA_END=650 /DNA_ORIENTATION=-
MVPYAEERVLSRGKIADAPVPPAPPIVSPRIVTESEQEASAQIYSEVSPDMESAIGSPTIEVVDHVVLSATDTAEGSIDDVLYSSKARVSKPLTAIEEEDEPFAAVLAEPPLVEASAVQEPPEATAIDVDGQPENPLTESMQSLVDGLMSWGSQYDSQEDLPLPSGLAASIVLDGSDVN